ncbi:hypothetical protein HY501_01100, partial [Candidatus Woesearchaeota archaeon]|nr:hypothetical protein [Candidatus Woesearchaeota archaeon]
MKPAEERKFFIAMTVLFAVAVSAAFVFDAVVTIGSAGEFVLPADTSSGISSGSTAVSESFFSATTSFSSLSEQSVSEGDMQLAVSFSSLSSQMGTLGELSSYAASDILSSPSLALL